MSFDICFEICLSICPKKPMTDPNMVLVDMYANMTGVYFNGIYVSIHLPAPARSVMGYVSHMFFSAPTIAPKDLNRFKS